MWGTNDLALAAFLVICGERLQGFYWFTDESGRDGTAFALFDDTWSVRHCSKIYQAGEAEVNAHTFAAVYGRVKNRMLRSDRRTPLPAAC